MKDIRVEMNLHVITEPDVSPDDRVKIQQALAAELHKLAIEFEVYLRRKLRSSYMIKDVTLDFD